MIAPLVHFLSSDVIELDVEKRESDCDEEEEVSEVGLLVFACRVLRLLYRYCICILYSSRSVVGL